MSLNESIDRLESLIMEGKAPATKRAIIALDKLTPILDEIRAVTPVELGNAEQLMQQKEAILKQAEVEAQQIVDNAHQEASVLRQVAQESTTEQLEGARQEAGTLVQSSSIVGEAQQEAEKIKEIANERSAAIIKNAEDKANTVIVAGEKEAEKRRGESDEYAREVLFSLEERLAKLLGQIREGLDILGSSAPRR